MLNVLSSTGTCHIQRPSAERPREARVEPEWPDTLVHFAIDRQCVGGQGQAARGSGNGCWKAEAATGRECFSPSEFILMQE